VVSAVPTGKASVQSKGYSEPETMVKLGRALVLSGTGTVHAGHVLKYKTVHHQYSDFTPTLADDGDFTDKALSELGPDVMKLGDRVHKFDFVGEPKAHY
jgi:1-aminocyclopropane-1-carboxylate deaminase/D-cysteine desulfhydrase-like pyridoxal-dependent ACC family enzyme